MNGKFKKITTLLVAMLLTVLFCQGKTYAEEDSVILTILHINDVHGRTDAEPYISGLMNSLTAHENILIFDAGDRLHGQTATNLSHGETMVGVMNAVGYNAMVVGNHDLFFGQDRLAELNEMMNFPILAANILDENGTNLFESYIIFDMHGIRVGVFGIASPETAVKASARVVEGLTFEDPVTVSATMVSTLTDAGCDIIIALTHLGDDDSTISENRSDSLAAISGIDIIIDGHSHTLHENGNMIDGTLLVQAGSFGEYVGVIRVMASGEKRAETISVPDGFIEMGIAPDEAIIAQIEDDERSIEHLISEIVGHSPFLLKGAREYVRTWETNLSNLITDSMLFATGADISFLSGGNIRAGIDAGDITMGQILTALPFSNSLVTLELSGADIFQMLEHGVSHYPNESSIFIHVAGINFTFDPDSEPGQRVRTAFLSDGSSLYEETMYTVATTEFLAYGGDGYSMLANGINRSYHEYLDVDVFANFMRSFPEINPEPENRVSYFIVEIVNNENNRFPWLPVGGASVVIVALTGVVFAVKKRKQKSA